jgi:hypothetical protein
VQLGVTEAELMQILRYIEEVGRVAKIEEVNRYDPTEYICRWTLIPR